MRQVSKKIYVFYIFLGYFAVSLILHGSFIKSFPHHIHAWAHCDHYAISKGFVNNNFDFFHPETYVYNKQFANESGSSNLTKTTAIDFPINNYIVAIAMKIFNSDAPVIFRLYTLIVACIGLVFLFLIAYHFSGNWVISFLIPIVVVFTPVYLDYQIGFLPSITSISLFFGGVYYFLKYYTTLKIRPLLACVVLLTLSTLIRTPFAVHLISLFGFILLRSVFTRKIDFRAILICLAGFALPILYFLYNNTMREEFGSIFLSSPVLIDSWDQGKEIIKKAHETWAGYYFNEFQYIILYVVVITVILKFFLTKFYPSKEGAKLVAWMFISFLGILAYSFLMIPQFKDHDYYFIDTFYPFIFIVTIYVLSSISYDQFNRALSNLGILLLTVIILSSSNSSLQGRRRQNPQDSYLCQYQAYQDLRNLLDKAGIAQEEKILIIDAYAPNMSFILADQSGYALIYRSPDDIINSFDFDHKYIVVSKTFFFSEIYNKNKKFLEKVKLTVSNDELLIFEKSSDIVPFEISSIIPAVQPKKVLNSIDNNGNSLQDGFINGLDFALTVDLKNLNEKSGFIVHVTGDLKINQGKVTHIIDFHEGDKKLFYQSTDIVKPENEDGYSSLDYYCFIPRLPKDCDGSIYFYNPERNSFYYKNVRIEIY
jgi:hypothetical protein